MLAGEPIRGLLQALPPVAHVAEQPPAPPPESLLEGDESQKLAVMVGALLLGHRSSHLRADLLTGAQGVKHPGDGAGARDRFRLRGVAGGDDRIGDQAITRAWRCRTSASPLTRSSACRMTPLAR